MSSSPERHLASPVKPTDGDRYESDHRDRVIIAVLALVLGREASSPFDLYRTINFHDQFASNGMEIHKSRYNEV